MTNILILTTIVQGVSALSPALYASNTILASAVRGPRDLGLSASLAAASALSVKECATKFRGDIWNCPAVAFDRSAGISKSREAAVVQAMTSAAIIHTIARNCSAGQLDSCGCGRNVDSVAQDWEWGGCSDNLEYGNAIADEYVQDEDSMVSQHNHDTGKVAVRRSMIKVCKCHGVSGSCSLQTCWTKAEDFEAVGRYLYKQYNKAVKVENHPSGLFRSDDAEPNRVHSRHLKALHDRVKKRKLVYTTPSPNYCLSNPTLNIPGVLGRTCVVEPSSETKEADVEVCSDVCTSCGLEAVVLEEEVEVTCKCRFEWCCNVQCQKCKGTRSTVKCVKPQRKLVKSIADNST